MIRRLFRFVVFAGIATAVGMAVRALTRSADPLPAPAAGPTSGPWPPLRNETSPVPEPAPTDAPQIPAWVAPDDGQCPAGHPIKAKMTSKIFHAPGQLNYDRTTPDRCYVDAAAAEADGLRAAKR